MTIVLTELWENKRRVSSVSQTVDSKTLGE